MSTQRKLNVNAFGEGPTTLLMSHGYGCDQTMWRRITPSFSDRYRIVLFDTMGQGMSDLSFYTSHRYASLNDYASDVLEIARCYAAPGPLVFVGHSVSAMVGMLASLRAPGLFAAQVMVSPSPCYIDDGDYVGGFSRQRMSELLASMDEDFEAWAENLACLAAGQPNGIESVYELTNSFCRTDSVIAANYARILLTADNRADLFRAKVPTLILQCDDDVIAPVSVGEFMVDSMPDAQLAILRNVGHCPHLTQPQACVDTIKPFLEDLGL